ARGMDARRARRVRGLGRSPGGGQRHDLQRCPDLGESPARGADPKCAEPVPPAGNDEAARNGDPARLVASPDPVRMGPSLHDGAGRRIDRRPDRGAVNWNKAEYKRLDTVPCYGGLTIAMGCNRNFNATTGLFTAQDLS